MPDPPPWDGQPALPVARALTSARMAIVVTQAVGDNPIVWANKGFTALTGYSRGEVIGRNPRFLQGEHTDQAAVQRMREALAEGGSVTTTLLNYRKDGTPFWNRMVVAAICDDDGRTTHHAGVLVDATVDVVVERAEAAEAAVEENRADRLALITRVIDALTECTDYHEAADALASTAVPELADWGFVVLLDDAGEPEHLSLAVTDPTKRESARTVERNLPRWTGRRARPGPFPWLHDAPRTQPDDPLLPQEVDLGLLARSVSAPHADALVDLGLGARLSVPLFARDRMLGQLVLVARDPDRFDVPTVVTATLLRRRAGMALDNLRLYHAERAAALTLQQRLLPSAVTVADIDTATAYRPAGNSAEIGGDWYDVFPLGDQGTMFTVGDVVGHDMTAAATMGQLSVLLRARSWTGGSPAAVLQAVSGSLEGMHWEDVASVVCLHWQTTADGGCHVEYSNLGHPAPFVRLPDGAVYQMRPAHCSPIGVHDPAVEIGQDELDLPPGSVVVLYTDGLVERRDRPLEDGLAALARSLRAAPDGTAAQVRDHLLTTLVHERPEDDVCLLVVRGRAPAAPDRHLHPPPALLLLDGSGKVARPAR